jgi:hypothetical protein
LKELSKSTLAGSGFLRRGNLKRSPLAETSPLLKNSLFLNFPKEVKKSALPRKVYLRKIFNHPEVGTALLEEFLRGFWKFVVFELGIDLIKADNSPKIFSVKKLRKKLPISYHKYKQVLKRLEKLPNCSKNGHLELRKIKGVEVKDLKELRLVYFPHRCHSILCPICSHFEAKRKRNKVFEILENKALRGNFLNFITLTFKPFENITKGILTAFLIREKVYNLTLSEKNFKRLIPYILREFKDFCKAKQLNKNEQLSKKERQKLKREIRSFIKVIYVLREEKRSKLGNKKSVKLGQIFDSIWKFEIHKTKYGWHPHFHIISQLYIPKIVLTAFWKFITKNYGQITDIRQLKGEKAIYEISKYETKPINSKIEDFSNIEQGVLQSNGIKILYKELLKLEYLLHGRKKIVFWGDFKEISDEELKEEEKVENEEINLEDLEIEEEGIHLSDIRISLKNSIFTFSQKVRKARKEGKKQFLSEGKLSFTYLDKETGEFKVSEEFEIKVFATQKDDIEIELKDKSREEEFYELLKTRLIRTAKGRNFLKPPEKDIAVNKEKFEEEREYYFLRRLKGYEDISFLLEEFLEEYEEK